MGWMPVAASLLLAFLVGSAQCFTRVATRPAGGGVTHLRARRACALAGASRFAYGPSAYDECIGAKPARPLLPVHRPSRVVMRADAESLQPDDGITRLENEIDETKGDIRKVQSKIDELEADLKQEGLSNIAISEHPAVMELRAKENKLLDKENKLLDAKRLLLEKEPRLEGGAGIKVVAPKEVELPDELFGQLRKATPERYYLTLAAVADIFKAAGS